MKRHWSETWSCRCGATFRSSAAEAKHRHNFPLLCRRKKRYYSTIADQAKAKELAIAAGFKNVDEKVMTPSGEGMCPRWMLYLDEAKRLIDKEKGK